MEGASLWVSAPPVQQLDEPLDCKVKESEGSKPGGPWPGKANWPRSWDFVRIKRDHIEKGRKRIFASMCTRAISGKTQES